MNSSWFRRWQLVTCHGLRCLACCWVVISFAADSERSPMQAVSDLDLYPGLEATLFASEPLIASPTNIDIDERGRIWVCEVQNYRGHGERDQRPEGDRILIMEDQDGDGVADLTKVFYQGRDVDAALGICVFNGRVVVTCAPNVILFTDNDGDDRPDSKEYLFTETGRPQNDHSTHSFVFGPDGHFYWNMGNGGWVVRDREGRQVYDQYGRPVLDRRARFSRSEFDGPESSFWGGMVFRCGLDGQPFEVLGHNFRNNYEVTVDSYGNLWQSDNDDDGNYGVRLNLILEGGNYGYLDERTGESWRVSRIGAHANVSSRHWHQNDPGVVPNFVQTGAGSPTGITVYEGQLLPREFWGEVLHCDAGPGVLWAAKRQSAGAGYEGEMVTLVRSKDDKWFRPVDVAVAPDGSLFLSDWYDPVVGWNRQADLGRGRIYRIAPSGANYEVPQYDFASVAGAVVALKSPTYSVRAKAWLRLADFGVQAVPALQKMAQSDNSIHRARAYWLLARLEGVGSRHVSQALDDADANIRLVGLRSTIRFKHALTPVLDRLVNDPSALVRRECALALALLPIKSAAVFWGRLADSYEAGDRWYLEALGIGAAGRWDECLNAWAPILRREYESPRVRDVIWRSRAASTPGHLAAIYRSVSLSTEEAERLMRAFDFQVSTAAKKEHLRTLVEGELTLERSEDRERIRFEALMRLMDAEDPPNESLRLLAQDLLADLSDPSLQVQLIQRFRLVGERKRLVGLATDAENLDVSAGAVRALMDFGAFSDLQGNLGTADSRTDRLVDVIIRTGRSDAVPVLLEVLLDREQSRKARESSVRGLIDSGRGAREVLSLARSGRFPDDLVDVAGNAFAKTMHVLNREAAAKLFPVPVLKGAASLPGMTEILVYVGDVEKGQAVFEKSTCAECHQIEGRGTSFGPDLSKIGAKLSKQGLYESILDPSASVSPSFRAIEIELTDDESLNGLLVSESEDAIVLNIKGVGQRRLSRSEIQSLRYPDLSAMPAGLQALMDFGELVDLVEFLAAQK